MKIFILDQIHPAGVAYLKSHAPGELVLWDDPRVGTWREEAGGVMVRLTKLTADDFAKVKKLKAVCKHGVGVESIDLDAARTHGVIVCNTPGVNSEAVADLALGLAISVSRRITELDRMTRAGKKIVRVDYLGIELWQKTVAIIGMGHVGTRVARKWRGAYDATILAYDPYVPSTTWSGIPHERIASFEALLPRADVLTVHAPLTDETQDMVGARELAMMKKTAIIVNTARGGIVNETALYEALRDGKLFGAGIDAFIEEPPPPGHPLLSLPNVIGLYHAGAGTYETQEKSATVAARELVDMLNGKPPTSRVA